MNNDELKFSVRIKYVTLIVGILLTLVSMILYNYLMPLSSTFFINDKINTIIQIFGIGIALTSLTYVAANQHFLLKSKREENLLQVKKYTLDLIRVWSTKEMFEFASIARKAWYNKGEKSDSEYVKEIINDESTYIAIISIINFFELISQVIDEKVVDEKMLRNYYCIIVRNYKERYFPLIRHARREDKSELIACDFEKLAIRWDKEIIN